MEMEMAMEEGVGWESGRGGLETAGASGGRGNMVATRKREQRRERRWGRRQRKRGMEGCDDGCAALVSCPLTKTLISVCVIPHCLLCLLILINYIHLPLPPSIPFSRPPSLCPPKITYWLSEPHLDQTCFYLLTISPSPSPTHAPFYPPPTHFFLSILYAFFCHLMSLSLLSSWLSLKKKNTFFFSPRSVSFAADCVSAWPA